MPPEAEPSTGPSPFEIYSPTYLDNPRPLYERMRATSPVLWSEFPPPGFWIVTSYAAANDMLRDPKFCQSGHLEPIMVGQGFENDTVTVVRQWMTQLEGQDHLRVRRAFGRTFLPRHVNLMRPRVERVVDELIDDIAAVPEFDFMAAFAAPFPITVICEVLGIPPSDRAEFRGWSVNLARIFDATVEPESGRRGEEALAKFRDYFTDLVAHNDPSGDGLLTSLIQACKEDGGISEAELVANLTLLVQAGHETTMNMLGNGMLTLLRRRERYERLVADPATAPGVVEEVLRYEPPLRGTVRFAQEDVHLHGADVRAGQMLIVQPQAVNADPEVFSDPATFDPAQAGNRSHLAFGAGFHYCLGAPLVRVEGDVAFRKLAQRLPDLELVGEPDWTTNPNLRGLRRLLVRRGERVAR
jgi:cytochrome P450